MWVNSTQYDATKNLYAALRRFRADGQGQALWIDALCINQGDTSEKADQVAMMGQIYSGAEQVFVWLGEPQLDPESNDYSEGSNETAVKQSRWVDVSMEQIVELLAQDHHFHELPAISECRARKCPADPPTRSPPVHDWSTIMGSLTPVFDAPWFCRAWTVQEIVLAQKATVIYGTQRFAWTTVSTAWRNLGRHMRSCCSECIFGLPSQEAHDLYRMASQITDLSNARDFLATGQHIIEPLLHFSWKSSSKRRDRLFGLLGLQNCARPTPVVPDYEAKLIDVFCKFAADLVRTQGMLLPLCLNLRQKLEHLPSWVPDWTVDNPDPVEYAISRLAWAETYEAAKGFEGHIAIDAEFTLAVDAMFVDTILRVGGPYELTDRFEDQLDILESWQIFLELGNKGAKPYNQGGNLYDAFWMTMLAGRCSENDVSKAASPQTAASLKAWVTDMRHRLSEDSNAIIGMDDLLASHVKAVLGRKLFETERGYIGMCPIPARRGDHVFVVGSCSVPVVLQPFSREAGDTIRSYRTFGHCYVHGIMAGEAMEMELPKMRVHIK